MILDAYQYIKTAFCYQNNLMCELFLVIFWPLEVVRMVKKNHSKKGILLLDAYKKR